MRTCRWPPRTSARCACTRSRWPTSTSTPSWCPSWPPKSPASTTAAWLVPFTGLAGQILPEHVLRDSVGAGAKDAPFNQKPIGTGPYKVVDFKPGDVVVYDLNPDYYEAGKPFFDRLALKGGGDAASAARAVLQTGEYDWAGNPQVERGVLQGMQGGKG